MFIINTTQSKIISIALICSMLISCAASTNNEIIKVDEPSKDQKDDNKWFRYYEYMFDSQNGKVDIPSDDYPNVALKAYKQAEKDWQYKIRQKKNGSLNTIILIALVYVGGYLIFKNNFHPGL